MSPLTTLALTGSLALAGTLGAAGTLATANPAAAMPRVEMVSIASAAPTPVKPEVLVSATGDDMTATLTTATRTRASRGTGDLADARGVDRTLRGPRLTGPSTNTIIGADNRVAVTNTTTYPYRAVALLYDTVTGARCSGFLIGPSTVATAGHCVFDNATKSWWSMSNLRVYPGYDGRGGQGPYGSCGVRNLMTTTTWRDSALAGTPNWDYDFGAIALSCTVGNTTGWFGLSTGGTSVGSVLRTAGYPGDKPFTQWYTTGTVLRAYPRQLHVNTDIMGGQSGSPAYRSLTSGMYASAIVSWEIPGQPTHNGLNRITSNTVSWFESWKTY